MSNPYEPPSLAPPDPHGQQPWSAQLPQSLPPQQYWQPSPPISKPGNGLAITALVVACTALLLVLSLILFAVLTGMLSPARDLHGTAPQVVSAQTYPGQLLADEVSRVISGDFGEVASMTCPGTPVVRVDAVAVCHGEVDGLDSEVMVTFQDDLGHFTLVEE